MAQAVQPGQVFFPVNILLLLLLLFLLDSSPLIFLIALYALSFVIDDMLFLSFFFIHS